MDWQQLVTLGIVLAAGGYLARRAWLRLAGRPAGACGSCSGCALAGGKAAVKRPLVPIEAWTASPAREHGGCDKGLAPRNDPGPDAVND